MPNGATRDPRQLISVGAWISIRPRSKAWSPITSANGTRAPGSAQRDDRRTARRGGRAVGPMAPGKTTCFYIITGLIRADAGSIFMDGREVTDAPMFERARGIGHLPGSLDLSRHERRRHLMAVLGSPIDRFQAPPGRPSFSRSLPSGTSARRLCSLGRRAAARSRVPAVWRAGRKLYPAGRALAESIPSPSMISAIVSHLKDRGIGVLITDHNVRDTLEIVDRAYILHEGEVLRGKANPGDCPGSAGSRVYLGERFSPVVHRYPMAVTQRLRSQAVPEPGDDAPAPAGVKLLELSNRTWWPMSSRSWSRTPARARGDGANRTRAEGGG